MNIIFEKTDGVYTLRDAIVLPEGVIMNEEETEAMKQERFDNWVKIITTPVENPNPEEFVIPAEPEAGE